MTVSNLHFKFITRTGRSKQEDWVRINRYDWIWERRGGVVLKSVVREG